MTAKPKPKAHKLDIFETLSALDRKDYTFLERQPEEDRKGFQPPRDHPVGLPVHERDIR
jgi:hypothetical protein